MTYEELKELHNKQVSKRNTSFEEYKIQAEFFRNIRLVYPKLSSLIFHIPNEGKRNRKFVKDSGVTRGVADVFVSIPNQDYHGFYIEFKTEKGKQSKEQKDFQNSVEIACYKYQICRSASEAFLAVKQYLNK